MQVLIEKSLNERIWKDLSDEEAGKCLYVSREFVAYNADSKPRSVADLSHLSDHYDPIVTKSETLEGFSASLLPDDHFLSMDLRSGFNHFRLHPDMRMLFTVRVKMQGGRHRYFQYLVLPFGWSRSGYWFSRFVLRFWTMVKRRYGYRFLSYDDDFAVSPSQGRAASAENCRKASRFLDRLQGMDSVASPRRACGEGDPSACSTWGS
jgi:Reverse transcriptase (RNA-dependent DNA polymerase)